VIRRPSHREFAFASLLCLASAWPAEAYAQSRNPVGPARAPNARGSNEATKNVDSDSGAVVDDVWSLLLPPLKGPGADVDVIATKIVRLGAAAVDPVVGILTGDVPEPDVEYPVHPTAIEMRTEILTACLRRLPRADVLAALAARATPTSTTDMRLLVVRWLSVMGGADALDRVLVVASSLDAIQYQRAYVQSPIEQGLLAFLAEDPVHVRAIGKSLEKGPLPLAPILARVVATSRAPAAASTLVRNLGRSPELDLEIVRGLGTCGAIGDGLAEHAGMERLRALLNSPDGELQRAAIGTLARLGDADSARTLVELLSHADPLTVVAARRGLEALSGARHGVDPTAWSRWIEEEEEWFSSRLGPLVDTLSSEDVAAVSPALAEILRHPLYRHAIATAWKVQLSSENFARRLLFARMFGSLGSTRAVPWLVPLLDEENAELRAAARTSLVQLTGLDLPAESHKWKALASN